MLQGQRHGCKGAVYTRRGNMLSIGRKTVAQHLGQRPGTPLLRLGLKFFAMSLDLERLLNRPVDLVIDGDLLPFAEKTAEQDKVLVYARS